MTETLKKILVFGLLVGVIFLVAAAVVFGSRPRPLAVVPTGNTTTTTGELPGATKLVIAPFTIPTVPKSASDVAVPASRYQEEIPPSLAAIPNWDAMVKGFDLKLSDADKQYLQKHKFILVPLDQSSLKSVRDASTFDAMLNIQDAVGGNSYDTLRLPQNAKLITPDIALHAYHKFFENSLEELEQNYLSNELQTFLTGYVANLQTARHSAPDALAKRYDRLLGQAAVAKVLLDTHGAVPGMTGNPAGDEAAVNADKAADSLALAEQNLHVYVNDLSPATYADVKEELRRIYESSQVYPAELFGEYAGKIDSDYTQYTPRSHYTKNSALRAYFRSMMYLGRSAYYFKEDVGLTDATLAVIAFNTTAPDGTVPRDSWRRIMDITGFYAGQSDDVTYNEWATYLTEVLGSDTITPAQAVDPAVVAKLGSQITKLRQPKILSDIIVDPNIGNETKADLLRQTLGFRLFGQRFTFDAWVLNRLTGGDEDPAHPLPSMPSATFIPTAFGSARAGEFSMRYLTQTLGWPVAKTANYTVQLAAATSDLKKVVLKDWFSSLGTAWLYVLEPVIRVFGAGYPAYMQDPAFVDKSIATWLASYTELKHDTVLYAKQSYAERGGGGPEGDKPPVVKGFVEPNIAFWKKLNALVDFNIALYDSYGLVDKSGGAAVIKEFKTFVSFCEFISEKELSGEQISEDEYEKIRTYNLAYMATPIGGATDPTAETNKTALVTDVHTDGLNGQILYEGTGEPYLMLALVGNEASPRVVLGTAYSHYEFVGPLAKRLTDETWKKWVYTDPSQLPPRNFWYESLLSR